MRSKTAIVLLSGGMDSTLCLFWAISKGYTIERTLSFYYGQIHSRELEAAQVITDIANKYVHKKFGYYIKHEVNQTLMNISNITKSALVGNTSSESMNDPHPIKNNVPASFVPGRNLLFLTIASVIAYTNTVGNLITGVCQTDFSGYADCRADTIRALNLSLNLGMETDIEIITPLMYLTKAESLKMILDMPAQIKRECWKAMSHSHTCYKGNKTPCLLCPACVLRAKGFEEAGMEDPLIEKFNGVQLHKEKRGFCNCVECMERFHDT